MSSDYCCNAWIMSIDEEDRITAVGVIDTLIFLRKNGKSEAMLQLHKRTTNNGILLNECRSSFDQFERPLPSTVMNNGSHRNNRAIQYQPVSSRTRNKFLLSRYSNAKNEPFHRLSNKSAY